MPDPLTGLPNRTAYTYDLACVWDRQLEHTIAYISDIIDEIAALTEEIDGITLD